MTNIFVFWNMTPYILVEMKEVSEKPGVSPSYLDNAVRRHSRECLKCDNISMCFYKHLEYLVSATHQNWLIAVLVAVSFSISCIIMLWKCAFVRKQVKHKSTYSQVERGIDFNSPPLQAACGI